MADDPSIESGTLTATHLDQLLDRLRLEPDEMGVVSIAARVDETGAADLVYASILFGPPEMAVDSWPDWAARTSPASARHLAQMTSFGLDLGVRWREFDQVLEGWLFGRWTIGTDDADRAAIATWLADLLAGKEVPGGSNGNLRISASAGPARSLIRTFPLLASPAGLLALEAHRPVTGYLFPLAPTDGVAPLATWDVDGRPLSSAPVYLLGLPISVAPLRSIAFDFNSQPMPGILLGRLERGAWLTEVRADPAKETASVSLGVDESRVSLADLELDLEEYESGDLAIARRLRLGDVVLPSGPIPPLGTLTVELPTLGPGIHRQFRLFDRDGVLLDATDRMPTIEQITVKIHTNVGPGPTVVVGGVQPATLAERLQRADRAEAQYRQLLEDGLSGRVIDDPATGLPLLTALLNQAHGHLDVLDPYFGWDLRDWQVLAQVPVPIRVLTGHGRYDRNGNLTRQEVIPPPAGLVSPPNTIQVRSWRGRTPPWHDRMYLWDGGGASVGTSPSGIGNRVARIDRVSGAEALGWQRLFDAWWTGPSIQAI